VIAAADPDSELKWLVEEANCGWAIQPDDAGALAATIEQAYVDREELAKKGGRGREYVVAHHSRQAVTRQLSTLIETIAPGARS
jgi:glycosyltransferase involved in cell wall biosynthesis